jgi:lipopolysaccharide biosynthesis glycosyltransferase
MINILFCGNDKVFDGMLTCALSILKRSEGCEPCTFYLYTMDASHLKADYRPIDERQVAFFEQVIRQYNSQNRAIPVDVTDLYLKEFDGCPNEDAYCSPYTLIRLLADLVDGMPDKLLYLDVDVLFNRDIHLLYDTDVSDVEYAAARDHYGKYLIGHNYINAGVLLWNLKRMKETQIFEKARDILRQKKLVFADQSALIRATTKKKMLPQKFNDQKFLHKHTVVRHFSKRMFWLPYPHTENIKQWHIERVRKVFGYRVFDDVFNEYMTLKEQFEKGTKTNL